MDGELEGEGVADKMADEDAGGGGGEDGGFKIVEGGGGVVVVGWETMRGNKRALTC